MPSGPAGPAATCDGGCTVDIMAMWQQMGLVAKGVAFILFFMSMWSFGVAIERIFTFTQARTQSKLYAPQVAKHLKEGRLKDAIGISSSKNHLRAACPRLSHAPSLHQSTGNDIAITLPWRGPS